MSREEADKMLSRRDASFLVRSSQSNPDKLTLGYSKKTDDNKIAKKHILIHNSSSGFFVSEGGSSSSGGVGVSGSIRLLVCADNKRLLHPCTSPVALLFAATHCSESTPSSSSQQRSGYTHFEDADGYAVKPTADKAASAHAYAAFDDAPHK